MAAVVLSSVQGGVGKTVLVTGIDAALRLHGCKVQRFSVGPGLPAQLVPTSTAPAATPATGTTATASAQHKSLPTGPAGLDGRLLSQDGVRAAFHSLSSSADISLIEGCLGMFDSPAADGCEQGTTAQLAAWLHAPVVLIIDAQAFSTPRSVLALIRGCAAEDGSCSIAGVILNKAAKPGLAAETQEALKQAGLDTAVLGSVPLVTAAAHGGDSGHHQQQQPQQQQPLQEQLLQVVADSIDLQLLRQLAATAAVPQPQVALLPPARTFRVSMGVAHDEAFFRYFQQNLHMLQRAGVQLVPFSPLHDKQLPPGLSAVLLGGGAVAQHAAQLSANGPMLEALRAFAGAGGLVVGEAGGLLYLSQSLQWQQHGQRHAMVGLFSFHTRALPHSQPEAQRYVSVTVKAQAQHPLLIPGSSMRGLAACCCQVLEERPVGSLSAALAAAASCSSTSSQAANEQQRQHGDASCASSGGGSSSMDMPLTPPAAAAGGSSNSSSESAASPSSYTYSYSCSPMTVVSSSSSSKPADVAASASSVIDEGYTSGTVLASAVQVHYGSCPELVQHMAQRCLRVDVATVTAAAKQAAAVAAAAAVTQQQRSHQLHVVLPDSPEAHQGCSQSSSHDTANMRLPSPGTRALSAPNLQDMVWHQLQPAAGTGDGAAAAAAAATPPPAAGPAGAAGGSGVTDVWFCPAGVADAAVGGGAAAGSSGGMPPAGALSPARKSCSVPGEMWQMAGAASGVPPPAGQHYHYQQQQQYLPYARYQQLQQQPLGFRVGSCPASAQGVMMMHHGASDGSAAAAGGGGPQAAASDSGGLLGQRWAPPAFNVPKRWSMELQRLGTTLTSQLRHVGHSSEGGSPRSVASASSAGQQHSQHQHSSQQQSQRGGGGHHSRNNSRGMMHLPEESPLSEAAIRALDSSLPSLLGRTHHTGIGVAVPLSSTSTGGGSVATASALSSNTTAPYCSNSSGGNLLLNTGGTLDSSMSRSSSVHEQMSSLAASLALQEAAGGKGLTLTPPSAAAGVAQLLTGPGSHTDLDSVTTVCTEPATRSGLTAELVHAQQQQQQHVAGSGVQGWASSLPVHKGPRLSVDHAGFGYGLQAEHSKGSYTRLSLDTPTAFASASATEVDFATAVSAGGGKPPQQHQQQQYHVSSGSPDAEAHLLQPELSFKAGVAAASHQQPLQVHAVGGTTGHLAGVTTTPHSATTAKGSGAELHLLAKKSATSSGSLSGMWAGGTPKSATALAAASAASQYGGSMGALLGSIVSLSPAATDILIALGLSSRVSGVTDSCRLSVRGSSSGGASGSNGCWQVLQLLDGMGAAWMAEAAEAAVNSNTPDVVCRLVAGPDGLPRYKLDEDCIRQLQPSLVVVACDENGGEEQPQGMQQQHHHQKGGSRAAANGSSNSSGSGQAHSSGRGFVGGGGSCTNLMTLSGAVAVPGRVRLDPAVVQRVLQRAGVWGEGRAVVLYQRCHSLAEVMEFMQVLAHAAGVPERGTALVAGLRARLRAAAGRVCMANEALARRSSSFSVSGPRGLSASSSNGSRGRGLRWGSLTGGGGAANGPGGGAGVLGSAAGTAVVGAAAVPGVSVMVLGCTDPLSLVGFWVPEMLQLAGVEPGALSPGPAEAPLVVSWPPLRDAAPDVLVLALPGLCAADAALHLADLAALPGFWGLPAVRAGAVYALDHVLLLRPGPSLVLGLEVLSHLAAPDQQSLPAGLPLGSVLKLGLHGGQRCRPRLVPHYMSRYC